MTLDDFTNVALPLTADENGYGKFTRLSITSWKSVFTVQIFNSFNLLQRVL